MAKALWLHAGAVIKTSERLTEFGICSNTLLYILSMVNYNLAAYLLVLLAVVAAVLGVALVDLYGQIDVSSLLSGRFSSFSQTDKQSVDKDKEAVLSTGSLRPSGFVDYPVVHPRRTAQNVFGPGALTSPEPEE